MDLFYKTENFSEEEKDNIESLLIPEVEVRPEMYNADTRKKIANFSMEKEFEKISVILNPALAPYKLSKFFPVFN